MDDSRVLSVVLLPNNTGELPEFLFIKFSE
jgi:hypothetical protein